MKTVIKFGTFIIAVILSMTILRKLYRSHHSH